MVENCFICQAHQRKNNKEKVIIKPCPIYPFQKVSIDLFKTHGEDFLVIADHYSGFFDFEKLKTTTSFDVIKKLKKWFSLFGIPQVVESDNGPQFNDFKREWNFDRQTSSPHFEGPTDLQKGMFK